MKLDSEFYRKLAEWEKLKSNQSASGLNNRDYPSKLSSSPRDKDAGNLRLMGDASGLTPEFKKKLEEWKRMNSKAATSGASPAGSSVTENRSVNRRRITDWQLWRSSSKSDNQSIKSTDGSTRLSDDFIKKMEEWRRIKSATAAERRGDNQVLLAADNNRRYVVLETQQREPVTSSTAEREEEKEQEGQDKDSALSMRLHLSEERRKAWKSLEDEEFRCLERVLDAMEQDRQTRYSTFYCKSIEVYFCCEVCLLFNFFVTSHLRWTNEI